MGRPDRLVEWLLARLDEDEEVAQAEIELQQRFFPAAEFEVEYQWVRHTRLPATGGAGSSYAPGAPSPARVLAEVAAKRQIIALHERRSESYTFDQIDGRHVRFELWTCATCCDDRCPTWGELGAGHHDPSLISCCETIPLLALPYAGRPGYDEGWRP